MVTLSLDGALFAAGSFCFLNRSRDLLLLLFRERSKRVLIYSINLVVVVNRLTFRALSVSLYRSSTIGLIQDPFPVAVIASVTLHHGQGGLTAGLALMSAVVAKARRGHLVITSLSNPF